MLRASVSLLVAVLLVLAAARQGLAQPAPGVVDPEAGAAAQEPASVEGAGEEGLESPGPGEGGAGGIDPVPAGGGGLEVAGGVFEYAVRGAKLLSPGEIEEAVYPHLGPDKTAADVELARAALEGTYQSRGYLTVLVTVPPQTVTGGLVVLDVAELPVGRLRVRGSRYYSLEQIRAGAPSLAEGKVPNFSDAERDIIALNQLPDRRVTPALKPGVKPGTVDVDLVVEDTLPVHGSLEINNRNSRDTSDLRLSGAVRYDNLWQLGHSLGVSFQVAPQDPDDSRVLSASYLARLPDTPNLSLLAFAVLSDSDVATLGDTNVIGNGTIVGGRALLALPGEEGFSHSVSLGIDYKDFGQDIALGDTTVDAPVTYYPVSAGYSAFATDDRYEASGGVDLVFNIRGIGSSQEEFDQRRFSADANFILLRGNASYTRKLPHDVQVFARAQGQAANGPLIDTEQLAAGGLDTVRGFLQAVALGDYGLIGTLEARTPSLRPLLHPRVNDWRFHAFIDAAGLRIFEPLPEQTDVFTLISWGVGSRIQILDYLNGSIDVGFPAKFSGLSRDDISRIVFRVWGEI